MNPEFMGVEPTEKQRDILKPNTSGANYTDKSIATFLKAIDVNSLIIDSVKDITPLVKHILIFTESIADNDIIVREISRLGITVGTIDALTKRKDREQLLEHFKNGDIKVMVNVGVLTTGFDFPGLDCLIIGRPTMSLALWYQMVGRVVRPFPDKTPVVVDLCGNYQYFGNPLELELKKTNDKLWDVYNGTRQITTRPLEDTSQVNEDVMTFGKFQGTPMSEVPISYLEWGVENITSTTIIEKFKNELSRRA